MASNAPRSRSTNGTRANVLTGRTVRTSKTATGGVRVTGPGIFSGTVSRRIAGRLGVTRGTPIKRTAAGTKANRPTGRGPQTRTRKGLKGVKGSRG